MGVPVPMATTALWNGKGGAPPVSGQRRACAEDISSVDVCVCVHVSAC